MYINYYFYVLLIYVPLAIFLGKPEDKAWVRILRLISLVVLGYVLANLALHLHHDHEDVIYEECLKKFDDKNLAVDNCRGVFIGNGAQNAFYLLFGWLPVLVYIGLWELLWRRIHRRKIKQLGKSMKARWVMWPPLVALLALAAYLIFCTGLIIGSYFLVH